MDFFSDILIMRSLGKTEHTGWFTFSLMTVMAPYLTVYTSLISYQINYIKRQDAASRSMGSNLKSSLTILPTMIMLLIVIDIVYMCI